MSWFFNIRGNSSGNTAEVNASHELLVALSASEGTAGYAKILDGNGNPLKSTEHGYLEVSTDDLVFVEQVDGSALNTNKWTTSVSGMTIAQTAGYITLNAGGTVASVNYAILQSIKSMPLFSYLPLKVSFRILPGTLPQPNTIMELGIGLVSGSSAPTDGAFFRWTAAGDFRGVISTGGVETLSAALTNPPTTAAALFDVVIVEDQVLFIQDDTTVAAVPVPAGYAYPTSSGRLPIFARVVTVSGTASLAPKLNIGQVVAVSQGLSQDKAWDHVLASIGLGSYQSPVTTFAQTSNHANSASPSSASLSNTTAGYTTLGGRFQFAAPAGAATDFALFAFQVPANYQLYVNRIAISTANGGAAVGAAATLMDWGLGINASAVSLATADGVGTWAPRRIPLGLQTLVALGGIGVMASDLVRSFNTPLVIDGGRFLHVILQVPAGLATISQIIRGDVTIDGYFE